MYVDMDVDSVSVVTPICQRVQPICCIALNSNTYQAAWDSSLYCGKIPAIFSHLVQTLCKLLFPFGNIQFVDYFFAGEPRLRL